MVYFFLLLKNNFEICASKFYNLNQLVLGYYFVHDKNKTSHYIFSI